MMVYIIEGLATVVLGAIALAVLPDYPGATKWLTEAEKVVVQGHLAATAGGDTVLDAEEVSLVHGIKWAAKGIRTWIFRCWGYPAATL